MQTKEKDNNKNKSFGPKNELKDLRVRKADKVQGGLAGAGGPGPLPGPEDF